MSTAPSFDSLVYYGSDGLLVYQAKKSKWEPVGEGFAADAAIPAEAAAALQGSTALIVVSDGFNGHLQLSLPNKKEALSDKNIGKVLEDEYSIELSAYEFASQKFTLSRDAVQMSVTGIERATYDQITAWVQSAGIKKAWVMPFAWFVSVLKSVDPMLLAVIRDNEHVLISHHYLGVDDAREIAQDDLEAYVKSRKEERKETHLLYVIGESAARKAVVKLLGDTVSVNPIEEKREGDALTVAIQAVMEKDGDTLAELLHFEVEGSANTAAVKKAAANKKQSLKTEVADDDAVPTVEAAALIDAATDDDRSDAPEQAEESDSVSIDTEEVSAAIDLPKPNPPQSLAATQSVETDSTSVESTETGGVEKKEKTAEDVTPPEEANEESVKESSTKASAKKASKQSKQVDEADESAAEAQQRENELRLGEPLAVTSPPEPGEEAAPAAKSASKAAAPVKSESKAEKPAASSKELTETELAELEDEPDEEVGLLAQLQTESAPAKKDASDRYVEVPKKGVWKTALVVFLVVVFLTSVVGGAIFWSQQTPGTQQALLPSTSPTPVPTATPEPSPTPEPEAELLTPEQRAEQSVLVLNATGVAGLAGRTQDVLAEDGWTNVDVGNASGSYDDAVFVYTEDDLTLSTLQADLDTELTRTQEVDEEGSQDYDVILIIADDVDW